jgi:hypothetical protein
MRLRLLMSLRVEHPAAWTRLSAVLCASLLVAAAASARAGAVLDVSGAVVSVAPRLEVRVVVTNRGDRQATPLEIEGELLGERRTARLPGGVAPGGEGAVVLDFSPPSARPGTHALALLLEHPVEGAPDGAGNPPVASQRAWLLVALGASPPPPVRLAADPLHLDVKGDLAVRLESADGQPHRILLRALTARGLRAEGGPAEVAVPARGAAPASLPIVRAGAPRGSRHAVLLVAEAADGPLARTAVLAVPADVAPFPSRLPDLRVPLAALGFLLVAAALGYEGWRRLRT